ncbi:hypothetical protein B7494_g5313 [Chlorociboria aeruginascens]|nr:hypothetical protein B7494_g5313 [Chlorociboria aeruginascens]
MDYLPQPALPPPTNTRTIGGNAAFHNFNNDYSHISDPNLRRRLALKEVDALPFGWYHIRACAVAGIGFFTDSYDIFAINLITSMLGMVFWQGPAIPGSYEGGNDGKLPDSVSTAVKAATSGGAAIGQLVFGWLADVLGRRRMYGVELAVIIFGTLAQALSAPSSAVTLSGLLIFWRVVMGIGIGGDYPLSAVIISEFASTRFRGGMMAAVFSMQGFGQCGAALVALVTTVAFKSSFINTTSSFNSCNEECLLAGDRAWRIIIGVGALPALFALYYRITIPETPRYTFDIAHDIEKADADIEAYRNNEAEGRVDPISQQKTKHKMGHRLAIPNASWADLYSYFSEWKNAKILIGTTSSWFFLDLAYYGLGLNNSTVLSAIGYSAGNTIFDTLYHNAVGNLVLVCAGSIPGYFITILTIDTIGRKPIQIIGFFFLTIIFCIIGFAYNSLSEGSLLALYILAQVFFNFGPNATTFIIPGEVFPTRYRSTGHGLSAACGKIGAIISQVIAQPLLSKGAAPGCTGNACSPWLDHLMQIFALFMLCGTLVSFLIPETRGQTLEELAGETSSIYNTRNDYVGSKGSSWWKRHNPFRGGKPAGFLKDKNHRSGPRSPGIFGKKERVGIMTSPDLLNRNQKGKRKNGRPGSDTSTTGLGYSVSLSSNGHARNHDGMDDDEIYLSHATAGNPLPGWGAGWGVQTNNGGERVQSVMLMDVGRLLK